MNKLLLVSIYCLITLYNVEVIVGDVSHLLEANHPTLANHPNQPFIQHNQPGMFSFAKKVYYKHLYLLS